MQYMVEALAQSGIRNIVIVVGYRKDQVLDYMGSGEQFGVEIAYVTQEKQLGTANALAQAKAAVEGQFLVLHGDKLIEADTIARFVEVEPEAILLRTVAEPARYGVATVEKGMLKSIMEKPEEAGSNLVNTGIYSFSTDVFGFTDQMLDIPDVLNAMIAEGYTIKALETEGAWLDVVYPWDILNLNDAVLQQVKPSSGGTVEAGVSLKGPVSIGKDTIIRANSCLIGPAVIGSGCDIGPNVCLLPATSIGNNVVISPFTEVKNSVIGDDVDIGPGCIIEDSVINKGCVIKGRFTACSGQDEIRVNGEYHQVNVGVLMGEGCNLSSNVTAQPGTVVGNYCRVKAMKLLSGWLPDKSMIY
jgi:glucose-1-phosphate thymidylyltransferase